VSSLGEGFELGATGDRGSIRVTSVASGEGSRSAATGSNLRCNSSVKERRNRARRSGPITSLIRKAG
jgi:hypothetical protein